MLEKASEIYLVSAGDGVRSEPDGSYEDTVRIVYRTVVIPGFGSALLHKRKGGAAHNEHRLEFLIPGNLVEGLDYSAFGGHTELAYAAEAAVAVSGVSKELRPVFGPAGFACLFLSIFGLDRKDFKHF